MPNQNEDMGVEFSNAAEAAEYEKYRQQAADAKRKLENPDPAAAKPADPVKALEDALPDTKKSAFSKWLQRNASVGAMIVQGGIDQNAGAINKVGAALPVNPFGDNTAGAMKATTGFLPAAGADVANAVTHPINTAKQVPSGMIDGWNEINKFGQSLDIMAADAIGYYPVLQFTDENGRFDPRILNLAEKDVQARFRKEAPLSVENNFEESVSMTGHFVKGISQFMAPYSAYNRSIQAAGILAKPGAWNTLPRAALAGFMADFTAFDPELGRLTDVLDEMGLDVSAVEYLKSDDDDTEMEARFKTALEGLGLGVIGETVLQLFKSGRSIKKTKDGLEQRLAELDRVDADAKARFEEDIYAYGRPDDDTVIVTPPPKARTAAAEAAEAPAPKADLDAEMDGLLSEASAARAAGDTDALRAVEAKIDANLKARVDTVLNGKAEATAGDRYFERDFFDLARTVDDEADFAFRQDAPTRERFMAEETAARSFKDGDMVAFDTRTGEVGVKLSRGTSATIVDWDWLSNIAGGEAFSMMPRRFQSIKDANEVVSKVMAVLESDARSSNSPAYFMSGLTSSHDKLYARLMPKLAERMGYEFQPMKDVGFLLVRKDVVEPMNVSRTILNDPPVSGADRAARAQKNAEIREEIKRMTGYEGRLGGEPESRAANALLKELESRGAQFATNGNNGAGARYDMGPETVWTNQSRRKRLDTLRKEARYWFGKDYDRLERAGRIQYARRASDIDPNWADMDEAAMGVTMPGGQVFIFTETVKPADMRGLVLHEAAVHAGLESMVGQRTFGAILTSVEALVKSGDMAAVRARQHAVRQFPEGEAVDPRKLGEETLAYIIQNGNGPDLVREIITHIKSWVAKSFPNIGDRMKWTSADYEALALMALRREAIVAGRLIATFGKGGRVNKVTEFKMAPTVGEEGRTLKLAESDRLDMQAPSRISEGMDVRVPNEALAAQVTQHFEDLLNGRTAEYLFRTMDDFDVFEWRDAVERVAQGVGTREDFRMIRDGVSLFDDLSVNPNFRERSFFEVASPAALRYWEAARAEGQKPQALVLDVTNQVFGPGSPDPNGFITSAENALGNLPARWRDAKALTEEQWLKAMTAGGMTGEALEAQVRPTLDALGRGPAEKITKEELLEGMARNRPVVETKSDVKPGAATADDIFDTLEREAPIANRILEDRDLGQGAASLINMLPRPLALRIYEAAEARAMQVADAMKGQRGAGEVDYEYWTAPGEKSGYRQELIIMPDEAKGYREYNWETDGVVGHIRESDRVSTSGEDVRFAEELQSTLNQSAKEDGYREPGIFDPAEATKKFQKEWDQAANEQDAAYRDYIASMEADRLGRPNPDNPEFNIWDESEETKNAWDKFQAAQKKQQIVGDKIAAEARRSGLPPKTPITDWEKPFIRRILQRAAQDGKDVIAFPRSSVLNPGVRGEGTDRFYDLVLPGHLRKVAADLGLKVEDVEINFAPYGKDDVKVVTNADEPGTWLVRRRSDEGGWDYGMWFGTKAEADAAAAQLLSNPVKVPAIRLTPEAAAKLRGGVPMFAMKEGPGRMDDALNRTVLQDIKDGRRALTIEESEALLGAAERWAKAVEAQQPSKARSMQDLVETARSRADPQAMKDMIEMMQGAKQDVKPPPSLLTFLRKIGGLKEMEADYVGELRNRDLHTVKLVNNSSGQNLDDAALAAQEAGYIGQMGEGRATIDDLLEAIDIEMRGEKVYSANDRAWVEEAAAREDMRAEIRRLGIDPKKSKKHIQGELERIAAIQEGEPLTLRDFEKNIADEKAAGAQPGIGLPAKGLLGGNEIRINFNAIKAADDIRSIMGQLADAFSTEIRESRGSRPLETVIRDAKRQSAWDALNSRREGQPLADAEVLAAQSLYVTSTENVKQALDLAMRTGTDTAHYNARRAITLHRAIQAEIAGAKADASRALRAWGIPRAANAQARRELAAVMDNYGGKLDPNEAARLRTMLDAEPEAADKAIRSMGSKVSDVAGTVLRFAWLSGPHTHMMNIAGNSLTMAYDIGVRLAVGTRGKILGDPVLERELAVALKEYAGVAAGVRAQFGAFARRADYGRMSKRLEEAKQKISQGDVVGGVKQGAHSLMFDNPVSATARGRFDERGVSGSAKYDAQGGERAISAEAFGMKQGSPQAFMINKLGALLSSPTEFLGFQDDFFKGVNELATRYREAQRMVMEELDSGALARDQADARFADLVDNPPQSVLDEAKATAQRRTFTEPVGEGTRTMLSIRNFTNKLGFPLGHILLPFIVTPSNILKFAFQNGPTGLLFREVQEDLKAGGVKAAMAQSRIAAGTGLLLLGMDMVAQGNMTGRGPSDPGERELRERSGKQEYSFKIGDKWVQYRRLEPVSTMLAIGADLQTIFLNSELDDSADDDFAELLGPVIGSAIQVVTSKTYLTSAAEFIRFTEDPERYGAGYFERLAASVSAPALTAQVEEVGDPVIREASNIVDRWMSRMPGFSKDLPASLDIWGRQRTISSGLGAGYDALFPFSVKTEDPEPIDKELSRIGFYPRRPDKKITVQTPEGISVGVNLKNRPDIWMRYVALSGNELKLFDGMGTKDYLNAVVSKRHPDSADYFLLPDSASQPVSKESLLKRRIEQARTVARAQLQREYRADLQAMAIAATRAERAAELRREDLVPQ